MATFVLVQGVSNSAGVKKLLAKNRKLKMATVPKKGTQVIMPAITVKETAKATVAPTRMMIDLLLVAW